MAITGKEDISIARKEVKESQVGSIQTTKTLIFKHEANEGDLVIDTTALTAPADALANGFVQDNPASINLLVNKKNLKIHSSRGVWLQMYEDFKVTGANTIQLIGNIASLGGALEGEVFTVYAVPVQANSVITTDHKKQYQEYILADGQSVLNLGREYEVGRNIASQIGSIRVFRNGQGPLLRNVANANAEPLADGNYQEIDAGNGLGTTLEFNIPASGQDDVIVVEFGLEYAGDFSLVGDIHAIWGSILKLADDVKDLGPYDITRYLTANPSEVERRTFGDMVLQAILAGYISPVTQDFGAMTIEAVTSNPTKGTLQRDKIFGQLRGDWAKLIYQYEQSVAGASGSGEYLYSLPAGLSFNTNFIVPYSGALGAGGIKEPQKAYIGTGHVGRTATGERGTVALFAYDATRFRAIMTIAFGTYLTQSSSMYPLSNSDLGFSFSLDAPVTGALVKPTIKEALGL